MLSKLKNLFAKKPTTEYFQGKVQPKIILISAVDNNYAIGYNNNLLIKSSADMEHFKKTTINNIVVMGRKTYESMGSKLLPNRMNIILTKDPSQIKINFRKGSEVATNYLICTSIKELFEAYYQVLHKIYSNSTIFIIGGEQIYQEFMHFADEIILTKFDFSAEKADAWFPIKNLDTTNLYVKTNQQKLIDDKSSISANIVTYKNLHQLSTTNFLF